MKLKLYLLLLIQSNCKVQSGRSEKRYGRQETTSQQKILFTNRFLYIRRLVYLNRYRILCIDLKCKPGALCILLFLSLMNFVLAVVPSPVLIKKTEALPFFHSQML